MIRSFYYHGADVPATDLKQEQLRAALADAGGILWVDLLGADADEVDSILAGVFDFHTPTIEDCLHGTRRPKLENHGDYIFAVVSANDQTPPVEDVDTVEMNVYVGRNYLVTYHPAPIEVVERTVDDATTPEFLAGFTPDSLAGELLEGILDDYRPALNFLSAAVTGVELEMLTAPTGATVRRVHELSHDVRKLRRVLVSQTEVLNRLALDGLRPVRDRTRGRFHQLSDRCSQMIADTEALTGTLDNALRAQQSISATQTSHLLRYIAAIATFALPFVVFTVLYASGMLARSTGGERVTAALGYGVTLLVALALALYVHSRSW